MSHVARRLGAVLAAVSILANARSAACEDRIEFLKTQLKTSDDFRVRTQAALALGATNEVAAVEPLCGALEDAHEAVRGASASALGKLAKNEGLPCLKARVDPEQNEKVKAAINKAIKAISSKPEKADIPENAKFYISIAKTNNKTSRSFDDIDAVVRDAVAGKLQKIDGFAVAPRNESASAAKKVITDKKLKGYEFQVTIDPLSYDGGKLTISLKVMITTYPGKDIKAAQSPRATQEGAKAGDKATEDSLLKALLEDSVERFSKAADSL